LNYDGSREGDQNGRPEAAGSEGPGASAPIVLTAQPGKDLLIPDGAWILGGQYSRQGSDLVVKGADGQLLVVRGFFSFASPPDLHTDGGAVINAQLATRLAGPLAPGEIAQVGPQAGPGEPIGKVTTATGVVEATRANGTKVTLKTGDPVYQGDVLETGKNGAVGVEFADQSTFSLGDSGRMVLDEMVYDPGGRAQGNSFAMSLVQGTFSFVSGQISKTDPEAMVLNTPVATIGIRGTTIAGQGGDDTIDGGGGWDRADYSNISSGVVVNLSNVVETISGFSVGIGQARDGQGGTDTLSNIEEVAGSRVGDDILLAAATGTKLVGQGGNDSLIGGNGDDTFVGGDGDDMIVTGNASANSGDGIIGGLGDDTIDFGSSTGFYTLKYRDLTNAIRVNLGLGSDQIDKGVSGSDTILNLTAATGSEGLAIFDTDGNDYFVGASSGFVRYRLLGGDDTVVGGAGTDRIDYLDALAGVTVTLNDTGGGTATSATTVDAGIGNDVFVSGIEQVRGSIYDDTITTGSGNETIRARGGDDIIDGGGGTDWARYSSAPGNVIASLGSNNQTTAAYIQDGYGGFDTLLHIENLRSGGGDDKLYGDAGNNWLLSGSGHDSLFGGAGNDTLSAGAGNDLLSGGSGNDSLDGSTGNDLLEGGGGADIFRYESETDSGVGLGLRDQINGFEAGGDGSATVDTFDLTGLGAMSNFTFAGNDAAFTGSGDASARYDPGNHLLQIDIDGDAAADMEMEMTDLTGTLSTDDFVINSGS
jgi:hypothetical protein